MSGRNVVLIDWELLEISNAIGAAWVALDMLTLHQCADDKIERRVPGAALGVLHLGEERLHMLTRALHHDLDPRLLLTGFNSLPDRKDIARDHLLVLRPWVKSEPVLSKAPRRGRGIRKTSQAMGGSKP